MKTSSLAVNPRYVYPQHQPAKLVGYTATYNLALTVRDLARLGAVLDRVVEAGANRDVGITFGCSDAEKLLDQARARAVADARRKAEIYVKGAGTRWARCSRSLRAPQRRGGPSATSTWRSRPSTCRFPSLWANRN